MLLLVAAALLVAQAVNLALLLGEVRERRTTFSAGGAIARTVDTLERIESGQPVTRRHGRGAGRVSVTLGGPEALPEQRDEALEARLRQALSDAAWPVEQVQAGRATDERGSDQLIVAVHLPDGRWVTIRNRLPPPDRDLLSPVIGQTLVLLLALLVAVIAIGRHVARPLRTLTGAAQSFGASGRQEPVEPRGPSDIQRLIETFNQMQSRILAMLSEKDRMLGAIGHDLRTPLASLRLRAESVEDEREQQKMIETIDEMARTLEDILTLARLGRSAEEPVRTDLAALIDSLVQDLQDLGQPVAFAGSERVAMDVRPVLLRRAIRNLIENAVKYGKRAEVRLLREDGMAPIAVIEIDDEGPGIPDSDIERVMEGFVRLDESRNRTTGGSGLGLTIARSIIQEHRGTLTLANLPSGGLRVTARLPVQG